MADLRCDFCPDNPAEFIVGNVDTGEQQFACRFDFARLGLTIAKAVLPQAELDDALAAPAPPTPPDNGANPPASRGEVPKRGRKRRSEPEPAPTQALAAGPTAAEDV
jgi:hypothetical protein